MIVLALVFSSYIIIFSLTSSTTLSLSLHISPFDSRKCNPVPQPSGLLGSVHHRHVLRRRLRPLHPLVDSFHTLLLPLLVPTSVQGLQVSVLFNQHWPLRPTPSEATALVLPPNFTLLLWCTWKPTVLFVFFSDPTAPLASSSSSWCFSAKWWSSSSRQSASRSGATGKSSILTVF